MFLKTTGTFPSSDGHSQAACYYYEPETGKPQAVIQISHGMCEYMERYEDFAAYLCGKGFAICGNDHLGHGRTAAAPEELGYFSAGNGPDFLTGDLARMSELAHTRYPNLPLFLFGHSMGSFIARLYLPKYADFLNGAIICGTSGGNPLAGAGAFLASITASFKGDRFRSPLLTKLAFGSYNNRFRDSDSPNAWLSTDPQIVKKYDADPWCTFTFTASAYRDLFAMLRQISTHQWAESLPKDLPLLLLAGEDDPVGDYGVGVRKVACRLLRAGIQNLSCRLYPNMRHEVLNERSRLQVYQDVENWIREFL